MAKPLKFKDFLTVDYTADGDDHISNNAKDRKTEALNFQQRRARARLMKKMKAKIAMGQRKAKKRAADPERLSRRSKKAARAALFKKFSKGKSKAELPFARRQEIEKRLDKMKGRIEKLARKLLPTIRKREKDRRSGANKSEK